MSLHELMKKFNEEGVALPTMRDPDKKAGSITATTYVISAGICILCAVLMLLSALSKISGIFTEFATSQQALKSAFDVSFQFFIACGSFHLGTKFQRKASGTIQIDKKD